jgi:hypothetical protein
MESKPTGAFNAQAFLNSAGIARQIVEYRRTEVIFAQGDPCESVLYIHRGGVKLSVSSKAGRGAVVAILEPGDFTADRTRRSRPSRGSRRRRWPKWSARHGRGVNFFMRKFQRLGFIDYTDGLTVNRSLLSVVLHD